MSYHQGIGLLGDQGILPVGRRVKKEIHDKNIRLRKIDTVSRINELFL
jgi:hypothetical protein